MRALAGIGAALWCLSCVARAEPLGEVAFSDLNPDTDVTGTLIVQSLTPVDDTLELKLTAVAPRLFEELDAKGQGRGNLGSCELRLYWVGPTRVRAAQALRVDVTSRARLEGWSCFLGKTRLLRDTKTLDFAITASWAAQPTAIDLNVDLTDIRNFPDELEGVLRDLGVSMSDTTDLPLGKPEDLAALKPRIAALAFSAEPGGVGLTLDATLVLDRAGAMSLLIKPGSGAELRQMLMGNVFGLFGG